MSASHGVTRRRERRERTPREVAIALRQAIRAGDLSRSQAEQLLGFVIFESLGLVPPHETHTRSRRSGGLERVGLLRKGSRPAGGRYGEPVDVML
jgi:hypothetical protein